MNLKNLNEKEKLYLIIIIVSVVALIVTMIIFVQNKPKKSNYNIITDSAIIENYDIIFEKFKGKQSGAEIIKLLNDLMKITDLSSVNGSKPDDENREFYELMEYINERNLEYEIPKLIIEIEEGNIVTINCKEKSGYQYDENDIDEFEEQVNNLIDQINNNIEIYDHEYNIKLNYNAKTGFVGTITIEYSANEIMEEKNE